MSSTTIATLWALGGWTLVAYSAYVMRNGGLTYVMQSWRDYVLMALLPALAVLHLARIRLYARPLRA